MEKTLIVIQVLLLAACHSANQPNIIVLVVDDLGYTDCGFHNGSQIPTPNIDWLAHNGIIFDNYYTPMVCTPSRASLLTGRHPMQLGLQNGVISQGEPWGLGLEEKLLPEHLKEAGYSTHAIGKWHLGSFTREYTPTYRGFDTHFGFWGGKDDYFTHEDEESGHAGLDFWDNMKVADNYNGNYGTHLFGQRAVDLINQAPKDKPFFIYLAHQAVHNAMPTNPLEAPQEYIDKFSFIKHPHRRIYAAMLSFLDDTVGNLTKTLINSGHYNNTILVVTTDNGGPVDGFSWNYASNWPLRGDKYTMWEGGVRGVAFMHSPLLDKYKKSGTVSKKLMHVSDWFKTLIHVAGGKTDPERDYYSIDQWTSITSDLSSPRVNVIHNYWNDSGAIRVGDFKLVVVGYSCCTHGYSGWYLAQDYIPRINPYVDCGNFPNVTRCSVHDKYCLFNITKDPCEFDNIAAQMPDMAAYLYGLLMNFDRISQPPRNQPGEERALPKYHNGHFTDWKDKQPVP